MDKTETMQALLDQVDRKDLKWLFDTVRSKYPKLEVVVENRRAIATWDTRWDKYYSVHTYSKDNTTCVSGFGNTASEALEDLESRIKNHMWHA